MSSLFFSLVLLGKIRAKRNKGVKSSHHSCGVYTIFFSLLELSHSKEKGGKESLSDKKLWKN